MGFPSACSGVTGSFPGDQAALTLGWQGFPLCQSWSDFFKGKVIKMKDKWGILKGAGRCWVCTRWHRRHLCHLSTRSGKIWSGPALLMGTAQCG